MKPRRESEVLKAVREYLAMRGAVVIRNNSGMAMMPGRGGKPMPVRFGSKGSADLIGVYIGRAIAVECKRPLGPSGGKRGSAVTPDQQRWAANWAAAGGRYCEARCIDDVQDFLDRLDNP